MYLDTLQQTRRAFDRLDRWESAWWWRFVPRQWRADAVLHRLALFDRIAEIEKARERLRAEMAGEAPWVVEPRRAVTVSEFGVLSHTPNPQYPPKPEPDDEVRHVRVHVPESWLRSVVREPGP